MANSLTTLGPGGGDNSHLEKRIVLDYEIDREVQDTGRLFLSMIDSVQDFNLNAINFYNRSVSFFFRPEEASEENLNEISKHFDKLASWQANEEKMFECLLESVNRVKVQASKTVLVIADMTNKPGSCWTVLNTLTRGGLAVAHVTVHPLLGDTYTSSVQITLSGNPTYSKAKFVSLQAYVYHLLMSTGRVEEAEVSLLSLRVVAGA